MLPQHVLTVIFVVCAHAHYQHQPRSNTQVLVTAGKSKLLNSTRRHSETQTSQSREQTQAAVEERNASDPVFSRSFPHGQPVSRWTADSPQGKVQAPLASNISPPESLTSGVIPRDTSLSAKRMGHRAHTAQAVQIAKPSLLAGPTGKDRVGTSTALQSAAEFLNDERDFVEGEAQPETAKRSSEIPVADKEVSELLRHTFMVRNPMMPSGYFDDGSLRTQPKLPSASQPSQTERSALSSPVAKRSPESVFVKQSSLQKADDDDDDDDDNDNDHDGGAPIQVESRSFRCTPDVWTCRQSYDWRILGEHFYPSRLYEVSCERGQLCGINDHFICTPILYTLNVLEFCLHGCYDQRVPSPLRSRWRWIDVNVTVGCQCVP